MLRVANGAGFLGDQLNAPRQLVENAAVDVLTLEYLAELTLSILAAQRAKNAQLGYARDLLAVLESLLPALREQSALRMVTNAGGVNPRACVIACARTLAAAGMGNFPLGLVTGDELTERIPEMTAYCHFVNLDTGQPLAELGRPIVSAHAYLGAEAMADALRGGARLVITGRVTDAALTLAPAAWHFGWKWDDWPQLAGATLAGHLIECGAQVTGGYSLRWHDLELAEVGYPIAELATDGSFTITKPAGSGGRVDRLSVIEQLVYEIGDPRQYVTPDVVVDFTSARVRQDDTDRVHVDSVQGGPGPAEYKVSLAYHDGYAASAQLVVAGRDCVATARATAELLLRRVENAGYSLGRTHVECLGAGESLPAAQRPENLREVVLRIAVQDERREAVERFTREVAPLITSGPAGLAGYAVARSPVRPVYAYWPTLVPKSMLHPQQEVRTAAEWIQQEEAR